MSKQQDQPNEEVLENTTKRTLESAYIKVFGAELKFKPGSYLDEQTMTSREIAELVKKRNDSVKRTIESLVEKKVIRHPQIVFSEKINNLGLPQKNRDRCDYLDWPSTSH